MENTKTLLEMESQGGWELQYTIRNQQSKSTAEGLLTSYGSDYNFSNLFQNAAEHRNALLVSGRTSLDLPDP
jgi:hypothetical protein